MRNVFKIGSIVVYLLLMLVLTSCFQKVSYTIHFDSNEGSIVESIQTDGKSQITIPNDPTRDGYLFDGWYWDNETFQKRFTESSLSEEPIASNLTVYAKWTLEEEPIEVFLITFNTMGGSVIDSVEVEYNQFITKPADPTREGYLFDGWYQNSTLTNAWDFTLDRVTKNTTLYASWNEVEIRYIVTFISNTDDFVPSQSILKDDYASVPSIVKEGHTLDGWYTSLNQGITFEEKWSFTSNPVNNDITLYAKWIVNLYTIHFESNGGSNVDSITQDYGTVLVQPNIPTKEEYSFDGWFLDEELTESFHFSIMPSSNITVYAKWNPYTRLIVGTNTEPNQNMFGTFWGNNATNAEVRRLTNGYGTASYQRDVAKFELNPTVVKALTTIDHNNGDRTYTIEIHQDLVWNNGEPITAKDYVFNILVSINPVLGRIVGRPLNTDGTIQGSKDYANTTTNANGLAELTGVKLINNFTFSIRILAENLPYYYEFLYYSVSPLPLHHLLPGGDVVQGEVGVKLTHAYLEEQLRATIDQGGKGYRYDIKVTAGPYNFYELDPNRSMITLVKNPLFKGNYEGQKPSIDEIIIKHVTTPTQLTALINGEIDLIAQVSGENAIMKGLEHVIAGTIATTDFSRNGYGMIAFHSDEPVGPTSSQAVRQAIALLLNRQMFADVYTQGYGIVGHGQYGAAQWMVAAATDEDGIIHGRDKDGNLVPLSTYSYNPDLAVELLVADGWIWGNPAGTVPFDAATHTVRYKTFTEGFWAGQTIPLVINWVTTPDNPVSNLIRAMLLPSSAAVGMIIQENIVDFNTMLYTNYYGANGDGYLAPEQDEDGNWLLPEYQKKNKGGVIIEPDERTNSMFNLTTGFQTGVFEPYYAVSLEYWGWDGGANIWYFYDEEMMDAAWRMMRASTDEEYLFAWQQYQLRFNEMLPTLPLYSEVYHAFFNKNLKDYTVTSEWVWTDAVLYARMEK